MEKERLHSRIRKLFTRVISKMACEKGMEFFRAKRIRSKEITLMTGKSILASRSSQKEKKSMKECFSMGNDTAQVWFLCRQELLESSTQDNSLMIKSMEKVLKLPAKKGSILLNTIRIYVFEEIQSLYLHKKSSNIFRQPERFLVDKLKEKTQIKSCTKKARKIIQRKNKLLILFRSREILMFNIIIVIIKLKQII